MTAAFPMYDIEGPARQRGRQYGEQAGEQIARAVAIYRENFAVKGIEWGEAMTLSQPFAELIAAYDAELFEEIEGIAAGAQQPLQTIVALNARTELVFWKEKQRLDDTGLCELPEECTSLAVQPEACAGGHMLHAQNWDWLPQAAQIGIVLRIRAAAGAEILTFVEAGQLARHGLNSAGLALTATGLHSDRDYGRVGVPSPVLRRRVLSCTQLGPALREIMASRNAFSHSLTLSHSGGRAICLETTPEEVFWLQPQRGIIVHANHFKHPQALAQLTDVGVRRYPESLYRDAIVADYLHARHGHISVDTVKAALADEFGRPDSVCRHPAPRPGGTSSATVATLIMDTTQGKLWIAPSPYQNRQFSEYGFS